MESHGSSRCNSGTRVLQVDYDFCFHNVFRAFLISLVQLYARCFPIFRSLKSVYSNERILIKPSIDGQKMISSNSLDSGACWFNSLLLGRSIFSGQATG